MINADDKNLNQSTTIPTSIAPWLSIKNGSGAVGFYKKAFGAVEMYRLETPDGLIANLSVNGAGFWVSEEPADNGKIVEACSIRMILTVADPDALFAQALAAGAVEVFPVGEDHGWRLGRLADPFGYQWEIGYQLDN